MIFQNKLKFIEEYWQIFQLYFEFTNIKMIIINKMAFNEQERNYHLLQWLNQQRKVLGYHSSLQSFNHIHEDDSILTLLNNSCLYASPLLHLQPSTFLDAIFIYMQMQHGKKPKKGLQFDKLKDWHPKNYISLTCFCLTQSDKKQSFIDRILNLPEATQRCLMEQIQEIEDEFENIMEVKEILSKVEELERTNYQLQDKIRDYLIKNNQLTNSNNEINRRNTQLRLEVNNYLKQKEAAFRQHFIDSLAEYKQKYQHLESQNYYLEKIWVQMDSQFSEKEYLQKELNHRVKLDCQEIHSLSEELTKNKTLVNQNYSYLEDFSDNTFTSSHSRLMTHQKKSRSSFDASDKENDIILRQRSANKQNRNRKSQKLPNIEVMKLNEQLMEKLEKMYKEYNGLHLQSVALQKKYKKLQSKNMKNQQIFSFAKNLQNSFIVQYFNEEKVPNDYLIN